MKTILAAVGVAILVGCADSPDPTGFDVQRTIDVPGNVVGTSGCTAIDLASCFAILDNQLKILYERTAWAARRGEAEYRVITGTNKNLSVIFQAERASVAETLRALDSFADDIDDALENGEISECWGGHLLEFGAWIRHKVATGNVAVSDAPVMSCLVSPVSGVVVQASESSGVVLTFDDPWHFSGDPYGVYETRTNLVVTGPAGTITTPMLLQSGAASVVVADPNTNNAGDYEYSVMQCNDWGQCSEPFAFDVTVVKGSTGTPDPGCVHDNRGGKDRRGPPALPICKKAKKK
jgi:hypothetical protein